MQFSLKRLLLDVALLGGASAMGKGLLEVPLFQNPIRDIVLIVITSGLVGASIATLCGKNWRGVTSVGIIIECIAGSMPCAMFAFGLWFWHNFRLE